MSTGRGSIQVLPQIGRRCQHCAIKEGARPGAELSMVCQITGIGKVAKGQPTDTSEASSEMQARCPRGSAVDKKTCRER